MTKSVLTKRTILEGTRVVFKYLKPYKGAFWFLLLLSIVAAVAEAFIPLLGGRIFDGIVAISEHKDAILPTLINALLIWLAIKLLSDASQWRIGYRRSYIATRIESEYLANGFGKLLEMPMSFHKHRKHGEVIDRINRASGQLENFVENIMITLAPQFLSILIALVIAVYINASLAMILVATLLIYIVVLWRSVPRLATIQTTMNRAYNRAYGRAYDKLDNVQEIKQATAEKNEARRILDDFLNKASVWWIKIVAIRQKLNFTQRMLITLTQLSVFFSSIFLVEQNLITPGELVAFNGYAAMFFGPFVVIGNQWHTIQNGLISLVRSEKILNLPTEQYHPANAVILSGLRGDIQFRDVRFNYEKKQQEVLRGVSFEAKAGEVVALVGESGVGKTTILDLLLGFYFPQAGSISIDGHDIHDLDLLAYRGQIAVVPQEVTLFNDTIINNIRYGSPGKSESKIKLAATQAHASEFIESFPKKYKQLVGWRGIKLSTGQKQRIAIARAILRAPRILILDEPTSALDAESEKLIKSSLETLMKGRTTFIVAHRLSTIREADKILVFEKGKIIESGRHEELLKKTRGTYRKLYNLQIGFY
ncbi:MAG: ABC transporter related-protein [Candidatus Jorgensenbacteria bacterium GW2011_GWA1_48_11]|uniref:ABC transporter related-protein n=1 Tax=Candidatus Jorgensenbacteria bacterium GW2011_GWA1_48_11 TaxID=1618660 RepID=A0A0G1WLA9_9BACT|nr:MAG: ABC transporter related-protein [Candidatus Jorgensenbacteria bacterium GW2011_GWA1_48_11]KKW11781.1 MAG: ABC transporter related-protein [Candidatus Jorgensenbacteria bacterium GW2011_GWB1_49_9]